MRILELSFIVAAATAEAAAEVELDLMRLISIYLVLHKSFWLYFSNVARKLHYRYKVWGNLEMSNFFKERHCFFNEDKNTV